MSQNGEMYLYATKVGSNECPITGEEYAFGHDFVYQADDSLMAIRVWYDTWGKNEPGKDPVESRPVATVKINGDADKLAEDGFKQALNPMKAELAATILQLDCTHLRDKDKNQLRIVAGQTSASSTAPG